MSRGDQFKKGLNRRDFLKSLSLGTGLSLLPSWIPNIFASSMSSSNDEAFPLLRIANLSQLEGHQSLQFYYPFEDFGNNILVKTGRQCLYGIGKSKDIVAFNLHAHWKIHSIQGAFLECRNPQGELSTFNLSFGGQLQSGKSSAALTQLQLKLEGRRIMACGFYESHQKTSLLRAA